MRCTDCAVRTLDKLGDVAAAQTDWAQASAMYSESLGLRQQLREQLGDTPQGLDDIGISLLKLATLPNADTQTRMREAESIYQRLSSGYPQTPVYRQRLALIHERLARLTTMSWGTVPSAY